MRKLILMAIARFIWRKIQARGLKSSLEQILRRRF